MRAAATLVLAAVAAAAAAAAAVDVLRIAAPGVRMDTVLASVAPRPVGVSPFGRPTIGSGPAPPVVPASPSPATLGGGVPAFGAGEPALGAGEPTLADAGAGEPTLADAGAGEPTLSDSGGGEPVLGDAGVAPGGGARREVSAATAVADDGATTTRLADGTTIVTPQGSASSEVTRPGSAAVQGVTTRTTAGLRQTMLPDGTTIIVAADGDSATVTVPAGSRTLTDGSVVTTLPDGTVITAKPGNTTSSVSLPNGGVVGAPTTFNDDGSVVVEIPGVTVMTLGDGTIITTEPGASTSSVTPPGGSTVTGVTTATNNDGSKVLTLPDGASITTLPDGTVVSTPAGSDTSTVTLPDGTVAQGGNITENADGSREVSLPDGGIIATNPDSSAVTITPGSGEILSASPDDADFSPEPGIAGDGEGLDGKSSIAPRVVGGVVGALAIVAVLAAVAFGVTAGGARRRSASRRPEDVYGAGTGVGEYSSGGAETRYTGADGGGPDDLEAGAIAPGSVPPGPGFVNTDTARHFGPPGSGVPSGTDPALAAGAGGALAGGAAAAGAAALAGGKGRDAAGGSSGALGRGSTPPPHDYVLGAGPANSRGDFDDIRTRFERDEIGDNSAVLGLGPAAAAGVAGAAGLAGTAGAARARTSGTGTATRSAPVEGATIGSRDTRIRAGPVDTSRAVSGVRGAGIPGSSAAAAGGAGAGYFGLSKEDLGEDAPLGGSGVLPDRASDANPPMSFETQEQMLMGGEGSGHVSDATRSLTGGSIFEERGDDMAPSLDRDEFQAIRGRDNF